MTHGMGGGMGAWILLWSLIGLALLVLIILAIIWMVRHLFVRPAHERQDSAEAELRRRYAAGEIDRDEYLRRRTDLRES